MSRVVFDSSKYYEEKTKLPAPNGINCIICGGLLGKGKKKYCSNQCFNNWYNSVIKNWVAIRDEVLKRDGKCVKCGLIIGSEKDPINMDGIILNVYNSFEVHHIKPICEGGEEFDPDNCITLCYGCHKDMHTVIGNKKRHNHSLSEFVGVIDNERA